MKNKKMKSIENFLKENSELHQSQLINFGGGAIGASIQFGNDATCTWDNCTDADFWYSVDGGPKQYYGSQTYSSDC